MPCRTTQDSLRSPAAACAPSPPQSHHFTAPRAPQQPAYRHRPLPGRTGGGQLDPLARLGAPAGRGGASGQAGPRQGQGRRRGTGAGMRGRRGGVGGAGEPGGGQFGEEREEWLCGVLGPEPWIAASQLTSPVTSHVHYTCDTKAECHSPPASLSPGLLLPHRTHDDEQQRGECGRVWQPQPADIPGLVPFLPPGRDADGIRTRDPCGDSGGARPARRAGETPVPPYTPLRPSRPTRAADSSVTPSVSAVRQFP